MASYLPKPEEIQARRARRFRAGSDELKVVVYHPSDFSWAEQQAALVRPECRLYLQPEWSKEKEMALRIVEYVKTQPRWRISLQVHKYLNIP